MCVCVCQGPVDKHVFAMARWLEQHLPSDGDVTIVNVTDDYGCLGIAGPLSRDVMASLTSTPMGNKEFPFLNFQNILLKGIPVLAIRVSYTGTICIRLLS